MIRRKIVRNINLDDNNNLHINTNPNDNDLFIKNGNNMNFGEDESILMSDS